VQVKKVINVMKLAASCLVQHFLVYNVLLKFRIKQENIIMQRQEAKENCIMRSSIICTLMKSRPTESSITRHPGQEKGMMHKSSVVLKDTQDSGLAVKF
jgi:hypothetical protein